MHGYIDYREIREEKIKGRLPKYAQITPHGAESLYSNLLWYTTHSSPPMNLRKLLHVPEVVETIRNQADFQSYSLDVISGNIDIAQVFNISRTVFTSMRIIDSSD